MHVDGADFINHQIKDYRLRSWRCWVIKSVSEYFKWMKEPWFPTIYGWYTLTIEKVIIGNTQPTHDDPGTSPEGPLKVLTSNLQGNPQRPSGESQGPIQKLFFRSNSPCICFYFLQENKYSKVSSNSESINSPCISSYFLQENKYSKVLSGDIHGTSTGPSCWTSMGLNNGRF